MSEGQSAAEMADTLRARASAARTEADRLDREAIAWAAGAEGERRVAAALAEHAEAGRFLVLHDRLLSPGTSAANLDHIVVSPAGAFLVDAKNWCGNVTVYNSSLWRHKSDGAGGRVSECMDKEVDKVRSMASRMEATSSRVVDPVLCLAGVNAALFGGPLLVRGVHVVPVEHLGQWFASREGTLSASDVRRLALYLSVTFPRASDRAVLPSPPLIGLRPTAAEEHAMARARHAAPGSYRSTVRRRSTASGSVRPRPKRSKKVRKSGGWSLLAYLVLVCLVVTLLPKAAALASAQAAKRAGAVAASVGSTSGGTGAAASATAPCRAVTLAQVSKLVGLPVHPVASSDSGTCAWGLRLDDDSTTVLSVSTGLLASFDAKANNEHRAVYADPPATMNVILTVPLSATVPGSRLPGTSTTAPIKVVLQGYTLKKAKHPVTSEQARTIVTQVAQLVVAQMAKAR